MKCPDCKKEVGFNKMYCPHCSGELTLKHNAAKKKNAMVFYPNVALR